MRVTDPYEVLTGPQRAEMARRYIQAVKARISPYGAICGVLRDLTDDRGYIGGISREKVFVSCLYHLNKIGIKIQDNPH